MLEARRLRRRASLSSSERHCPLRHSGPGFSAIIVFTAPLFHHNLPFDDFPEFCRLVTSFSVSITPGCQHGPGQVFDMTICDPLFQNFRPIPGFLPFSYISHICFDHLGNMKVYFLHAYLRGHIRAPALRF